MARSRFPHRSRCEILTRDCAAEAADAITQITVREESVPRRRVSATPR